MEICIKCIKKEIERLNYNSLFEYVLGVDAHNFSSSRDQGERDTVDTFRRNWNSRVYIYICTFSLGTISRSAWLSSQIASPRPAHRNNKSRGFLVCVRACKVYNHYDIYDELLTSNGSVLISRLTFDEHAYPIAVLFHCLGRLPIDKSYRKWKRFFFFFSFSFHEKFHDYSPPC